MRHIFGFTASYSAMIDSVICIPHQPHYAYDLAGKLTKDTRPIHKTFPAARQ